MAKQMHAIGGNIKIEKTMRFLVLLFTIVLNSNLAIGQEKVKIEDVYVRKDIPKPFIVWWIRDLYGSGSGQVERLELRTDGTFYYSHHGGYCGTFDTDGEGIWIKENDRLILKPNDEYLTVRTNWIIDKSKLYASLDSLNNGVWALKKK